MPTNNPDKWTAPSGAYNAAVDMIDRNVVEGSGAKVAFIDPKRQLTYAQLGRPAIASPTCCRGLASRASGAFP